MEGSEKRLSNEERRTERRAEKRQAILDGAVRVFAEKGFFNGTMAEIARAAGVADGTLYLYFESKDDLLLSIFDEKMQELCKRARDAIAGVESAVEAVRQVCLIHLAAVEENPELAAVLIVELRQSNAFVRDVEKPGLSAYLALIGDLVKRGQSLGEIRADVHPGAVKRALFGALDEIALGWLLSRRRFDLARTAREMADMFVRGLVAAPAPSVVDGHAESRREAAAGVSPTLNP
jgi:TetR/AcrR family fatty acid metabolism transcriptional regulator